MQRRDSPGFCHEEEAPLLPFYYFSTTAVGCSRDSCDLVSTSQRRSYRYRFYPTPDQKAILARTFGSARFVYNWALRMRTDAYYQRQERISYADTSAAVTALKREPETAWLNEVSSVPPQQALRHLDRAFRHFFEGHAKNPPSTRSTAGRQRNTPRRPSVGTQLPKVWSLRR